METSKTLREHQGKLKSGTTRIPGKVLFSAHFQESSLSRIYVFPGVPLRFWRFPWFHDGFLISRKINFFWGKDCRDCIRAPLGGTLFCVSCPSAGSILQGKQVKWNFVMSTEINIIWGKSIPAAKKDYHFRESWESWLSQMWVFLRVPLGFCEFRGNHEIAFGLTIRSPYCKKCEDQGIKKSAEQNDF